MSLQAQRYRYKTLANVENGIRLVKLQPAKPSKRICIVLEHSWVSRPESGQKEHAPYDALSYTWGTGGRSKQISCDDKPLDVTETLHEALLRFRDQDRVVTLWIDQICIHQDNILERNRQVRMMGRIFTGASRVIVWLGHDYDNSDKGMQLAEQLAAYSRRHRRSSSDLYGTSSTELSQRGSERLSGLSAILRRPWWLRTWIVQEVVLNPNVELVVGYKAMSWDDLEAVVNLLEGPTSQDWLLDPTLSAWELPFSRINRIRRRHQTSNTTANTSAAFEDSSTPIFEEPKGITRDATPETNSIDLLDLLLMSRNLQANDHRDKVYALVGLSNHDLIPDYNQTTHGVFNEFARHTVGEATSIAHDGEWTCKLSSKLQEARRILVLLSCAGYHNRLPDLFSWAPDWTATLLSRPLVFDDRFGTGGDELEINWDIDRGLVLCGKLFDTVHVAGTTHLAYEQDPDIAHSMIDRWWVECKTIAHQRAVHSPGSTSRFDAFQYLCRDLFICKHGYYKGKDVSAASAWSDARTHRRRSLLDEYDLGQQWSKGHDPQETLTLGPTRGRVFFTTTTGYIGLAPHGTVEGDLVYIVLGASVPYVLRPKKAGEGFTLVGEAYVQGIMNGEALHMNTWGFSYISIR